MRFIPSQLNDVENAEEYIPGGFHPVAIGDIYANGRYKILHKLGFGGSSTVWLARDYGQNTPHGRLVALKVMCADVSAIADEKMPELVVPRALHAIMGSCDFQIVDHHFLVQGPNGCHRVLAYPLAGPSIRDMVTGSGRIAGSRRLRGDLARAVAKQAAMAIRRMHLAGIVHGDLTTSNILFRVARSVVDWTDDEVYAHLGLPRSEVVRTFDGSPPGLHAATKLVESVKLSRLAHLSLIQERITIIDFGQSYFIRDPPKDYEPATAIHYQSPEMRFDDRAGAEADVWSLGCAIFEIRSGYPLFEPLFGSTDIMRQTVETLGRLPDPWWNSFKQRVRWFEDDGEPKDILAQKQSGVRITARKTSISEKLRSIGDVDEPPSAYEGPMIERCGVKLSEEQVESLSDLLGRMLKYRPEERPTMEEVIHHRWFNL
ncbi:kinase-like protein [Punctularia strigosozonata HHB-11173 SS5]|uniref:Kinase-like protein n=1 Tax=Punctularia strigosozonata (strain HHB-11173) TaxID=741275 RepID=R7S0W8_PUNST|nr:kinase-like protein [Punctularia strigosozonata HHB-11173 SS5]EIN04030.1 kinase-like protein [Punctularia strigosozonata HHB-11173 SS5]